MRYNFVADSRANNDKMNEGRLALAVVGAQICEIAQNS